MRHISETTGCTVFTNFNADKTVTINIYGLSPLYVETEVSEQMERYGAKHFFCDPYEVTRQKRGNWGTTLQFWQEEGR